MYPARQECSASPPGPAATAAAPRPPAPHREPRGTHRGPAAPAARPAPGPAGLRTALGVTLAGGCCGGPPGVSRCHLSPIVPGFPGGSQNSIPSSQSAACCRKGIFLGSEGKRRRPTPALGLASSPSNKTAPKGAELPEIAPPARNSPAGARQQPPDRVSSPSGSSWLPSRWDPASSDGCPRCCRATLLLANQHQFFSGKLYVLLQ